MRGRGARSGNCAPFPGVREMFTKSIVEHIEVLAGLLPASATPEARRSVATAIIAGTTGMIQLARAVDDEELSDKILEDGIAACLSLARAIKRLSRGATLTNQRANARSTPAAISKSRRSCPWRATSMKPTGRSKAGIGSEIAVRSN